MNRGNKEAAWAARGLTAAALIIVGIWVCVVFAYSPSMPSNGDLPKTEFSSARAFTELQQVVSSSTPHPMGSAANAAVRDRILARLRQRGYSPELQKDTFVCDPDGDCGTPNNIVVRVPGTEDGSLAVVLAAHYDSVAAGPGASDDGTGVAVLLEIARILQLTPRMRHPVVILFTDGEEVGLLGARAFVSHHPLGKL